MLLQSYGLGSTGGKQCPLPAASLHGTQTQAQLTQHPLRDFFGGAPVPQCRLCLFRDGHKQVWPGRHFPCLQDAWELGGRTSPSVSGLISGAPPAPPPGSQTWGAGVGLPQVRSSKELFKAAGSSPLLFTALPGGNCRHAPTGAAGTQQPVHPHRAGAGPRTPAPGGGLQLAGPGLKRQRGHQAAPHFCPRCPNQTHQGKQNLGHPPAVLWAVSVAN